MNAPTAAIAAALVLALSGCAGTPPTSPPPPSSGPVAQPHDTASPQRAAERAAGTAARGRSDATSAHTVVEPAPGAASASGMASSATASDTGPASMTATPDAATRAAAAPGRAGRARMLRVGSRGADARRLNARLAALGYLPSGADTDRYTTATYHAVLAFQKWEGLARDGVAGQQTQAMLRHATRPRPSSGAGRYIEVQLGKQVALLVSGGRAQQVIAISSGQPGYDTPQGSFTVTRKELRSWSVPYQVWLPYASYFTGGVAFHAYPSVPAYPASHGCVRVPEPFAAHLYRFARMGTAVHVLD